MDKELQIGLIGLDTSHVPAFCQLLNDATSEYSVPGGKVTVAFAGGSPDFPLSQNRVAGYTREVEEKFGVTICDSPRGVAQQCDAVFITAVDGRAHRAFFEEIAPLRKPTFIDKPFAVTSQDAQAMAALANEYSIPLMSCSSLRYAQPVVDELAEIPREKIVSVDASGPMALQPTQNNLFWYAIHSAEMLFAALGEGCTRVFAAPGKEGECITGIWQDGRVGTIRGDHAARMPFGFTLYTAGETRFCKPMEHPKPAYAGLLDQVLPFLRGEANPIELSETVEIVRFLEAATQSRQSGQPVTL